jgi:hypothetical protein
MDLNAARQLMIDFFGKYYVWDPSVAPLLRQSFLQFDEIAKKATAAHKKVMKCILREFRKCEVSARQELHVKWKVHEDEIEAMAQNLDNEIQGLVRRAARAGVKAIPSPLDALVQMRRRVKQGIDQATSRSRQLSTLPLFN